ncbi:MAG TPA: hypothetical protein VFN64_00575 [Burkholderiaceae bacterium]|nr:hypothetical protein [Burkholderiaceae bacterium]
MKAATPLLPEIVEWMQERRAHIRMRYLSLGAGVQSSTLALMSAVGEAVRPDFAVFADTGAEPRSVYAWLDWLETQLPYPVHRVRSSRAETLTAYELKLQRSRKSGRLYRNGSIPAFSATGMLQRRCTASFKIDPIVAFARRHAKPPRQATVPLVEQHLGITIDEAHRMKASHQAWIENVYPLVEKGLTRADCLAWMRVRGYPQPPRSACVYCPYHSDAEWIRLRDEEPEEFAKAVAFEEQLQAAAARSDVEQGTPFLHRTMIPLREVSFRADAVRDGFGNECEGMCGI